MNTRKAVFAGSWYPGTAEKCEQQIKTFLKDGSGGITGAPLVGGIVPHAGWFFSGSIACNVIHCLAAGPPPDTVVVFGMHLPPGSPSYIMPDGAWESPFGPLQIDEVLAAALMARFSFQVESPGVFARDNTIELQVPFLRYFLPDAQFVPIGVPPSLNSLEIGLALAEIAREGGLKVMVLGSTDLTHYGVNYGFEPQGRGRVAVDWVRFENDRRIIEAMLAMDPEAVIREGLDNKNACCAGAAATALTAGKAMGAKSAESLSYATSYEKNPDDSFVGYVGIVF